MSTDEDSAAAPSPSAAPAAVNPGPSGTRNENEYQFLVTRQKEFKRAALQAKQSGDIVQAREYLRQAKVSWSFDIYGVVLIVNS